MLASRTRSGRRRGGLDQGLRERRRVPVEIDPVPLGERRRLVAAEIMRAVYYETLVRIEQNDYDVFTKPTRLAKPVQAAIALRQWLWPQ